MPSQTCSRCNGEGTIRGFGDNMWRILPWVTLSFLAVVIPAVWFGFQWSQTDRRSMCGPAVECPAKEAPKEFADIPKGCARVGNGPIVCPRGGERLRVMVESTTRDPRTFENVIYFDRPSPLPDGGVD